MQLLRFAIVWQQRDAEQRGPPHCILNYAIKKQSSLIGRNGEDTGRVREQIHVSVCRPEA